MPNCTKFSKLCNMHKTVKNFFDGKIYKLMDFFIDILYNIYRTYLLILGRSKRLRTGQTILYVKGEDKNEQVYS